MVSSTTSPASSILSPTTPDRRRSFHAYRALVGNVAAGGDGSDQPYVPADHRPGADDRVPAENRRSGVDRDVVLERRMALGAGLPGDAPRQAEGPQRNPLIDLHVVADHRGLADDHPG